MDIILTKSKLTFEELNNKSVEFKIPSHGIGTFKVRKNDEGLLAIDIDTDIRGNGWNVRGFTRYNLTQDTVDAIQIHPNQSIARFLLTYKP